VRSCGLDAIRLTESNILVSY